MQRLTSSRECRLISAAVGITVALGVILVNGMIFSKMRPKKNKEPLDYLIVLGARLHGETAGAALQSRIDKATEYLLEHPQTVAVLSGGKPHGAEIAEAEYMLHAFQKAGIPPERLILEPMANDTEENLLRSFALIPEDASFGILTNDFHIFRTERLLKRLGYEGAFVSVPYPRKKLPPMLLRENIAIVCSFFMGKL